MDYLLVLVFGAAIVWGCVYAIRCRETAEPVLEGLGKTLDNWYFALLVLFFLLMCLSGLLTEREAPGSFRENMGCLFDAGISLFLLFPLGCWYGLRGDRRFLHWFIDLLTGIYVCILLYGLWGLYTGNRVVLNGAEVLIYKRRLYLGCNPNTTGLVSALFLMTGAYRLLSGGKTIRCLYAAAMPVLYTALALSNSRGSAVAATVGFGVLTGVLVWTHFAGRKERRLLVLLSLGAGAAVALIFWGGRALVHMTVPPERAVDGIGLKARGLLGDGAEEGSGRLVLWRIILNDVLPGRKRLLLHGCGPYSVGSVLDELGGVTARYGHTMYTHNQLLEVLMAYGSPALGVFFAWLLLLAGQCLRLGTAPVGRVRTADRVLPLVLLLLVINNMFEATLLFYRYVSGSVFFLIAGYTCALCPPRRPAMQEQENKEAPV